MKFMFEKLFDFIKTFQNFIENLNKIEIQPITFILNQLNSSFFFWPTN